MCDGSSFFLVAPQNSLSGMNKSQFIYILFWKGGKGVFYPDSPHDRLNFSKPDAFPSFTQSADCHALESPIVSCSLSPEKFTTFPCSCPSSHSISFAVFILSRNSLGSPFVLLYVFLHWTGSFMRAGTYHCLLSLLPGLSGMSLGYSIVLFLFISFKCSWLLNLMKYRKTKKKIKDEIFSCFKVFKYLHMPD